MKIQKQYQSRSSASGTVHTATFDTDSKTARCTCRGYKGPSAICWHVEDMLALHAGITPSPAAQAKGAGRESAKVEVVTGTCRHSICTATPIDASGYCAGHRHYVTDPSNRGVVGEVVTTVPRFEPMLASAMTKGQTVESYATPDWVLEEKYDGHRQLVTVKAGQVLESRSRAGNGRTLPMHVSEALALLPDGLYDGELVAPAGMSSDVTRLDLQDKLTMVLFDVLELMGEVVTSQSYMARRQFLTIAWQHIQASDPGNTAVVLASSEPVSRKAVERIWARGGEGAILKRVASRYQPGYRSADWVKVKKELTVTVTVLGFETGDTGIAYGRTLLRDDKGYEFSVKTLNNAIISEVARNPFAFVGKRLVVKFNEQLKSGAYRHPMFDHFAGEGE